MGKRIVITGAGTGLGRAMGLRLARDGHSLFLLGRREEKLAAVVAEIGGAKIGGTGPVIAAVPIVCDVADPASVEAAFARIGASGGIDVLINNAGVYQLSFVAELTNDQLSTMLSTNLAGPILCARAAIPLLPRGGHILCIGSETVEVTAAMMAVYQSTKAGLERFAKTLGQELAPAGIRVTMLRAGKMMGPGMEWHQDAETARRFAEESLRIGVDNRKSALSSFASVAELIPALLALPEDVNIPHLTVEARHP